MAILARPLPRFFLWAVFLVGIAIATAAAALSWWLIALVELAAWGVVSLVERTLWHRSVAPRAEVERAELEIPAAEPAVAAPPPAAPAPAPVAVPEPQRRIERVRRVATRVTTPRLPPTPQRWSVWTLEKLAQEHPEEEELEFLVLSLRDFADADGHLPSDFDSLVRESFGELLAG